MDRNVNGLIIQKAATATDGYEGGLQIIRDTTLAVGGERGMVNCGTIIKTIAGKDVKNFEWNLLCLMDNYADEGENVALYAQGNKHGLGPIWGACIEACDTTGNTSGTVGAEVDCWITGADTGSRIGLDVTLGDAKQFRGMGPSQIVEGTAGIRIGSSASTPNAKWTTGLAFSGRMDTAIDCTKSSTSTAIRLSKDQHIIIGDTKISDAGVETKTSNMVYAALALSILAIIITIAL